MSHVPVSWRLNRRKQDLPLSILVIIVVGLFAIPTGLRVQIPNLIGGPEAYIPLPGQESRIQSGGGELGVALLGSVATGSGPVGVAYDKLNGDFYIANSASNNVSVRNGSTGHSVKPGIAVGSGPWAVAFDSTKNTIFVTNTVSNNVTVISGSTNKVTANIHVGNDPMGVAFDSSTGYVYVTNAGSDNITYINGGTNKVSGAISLGTSPVGITFDSANGYFYTANEGANTVTVVNGLHNSIVVSAIAVGKEPTGVFLMIPPMAAFTSPTTTARTLPLLAERLTK